MSDKEDESRLRDWEIDPEVLEDLRLRGRSEHDQTRSRPTDVNKLYRPFVPTAAWRCRHPKCEEFVLVDDGAVSTLAVFNEELKKRGERVIPEDAIMLCREHRNLAASYRVESLQKRQVRLRDAIQKIKASANPRSERAPLDELKACHHPDIEGLLQSLTDKLEKSGAKKRRTL